MHKPLPLEGWLTLLSSFFILAVAFSFGLFSLPVFYPALVKSFGWNRASVAGGGSIVLLLIGILSPVVGWLSDQYSPKAVLLCGMVTGALALALLSLTHSLEQYYGFSILLGMGTSAVSILPNSLLVAPWFAHRRGVAVGFVNAGIGLGGIAPERPNRKKRLPGRLARRLLPGNYCGCRCFGSSESACFLPLMPCSPSNNTWCCT